MVLLIMRKRTHDEYVAKVADINSNIEVIDKYISAHTKILHRCLVDGNEWYASPNNIIRGCGCPICGNIAGAKKKARSHICHLSFLTSNLSCILTVLLPPTTIIIMHVFVYYY